MNTTIQTGSTVRIPHSLTTDPINKQGEIGVVTYLHEKHEEVAVRFKDGIVGFYQNDAVELIEDTLN